MGTLATWRVTEDCRECLLQDLKPPFFPRDVSLGPFLSGATRCGGSDGDGRGDGWFAGGEGRERRSVVGARGPALVVPRGVITLLGELPRCGAGVAPFVSIADLGAAALSEARLDGDVDQ